MEEQAPQSSIAYGKPCEMRLPIYNPAFELIYDPRESTEPSYFACEETLVTYIDESAYQKICRHAESDTRNEVGGALLGKYCIDQQVPQRFLLVTDIFPATPERNDRFSSPVLMKFTHTFFRKLDDYMDTVNQNDPSILRLGMYHSHPGYGVFMSSTDIATFRGIFVEPWHISFIIDPVNCDAGVFYWQKHDSQKEVSQKTGFSLFKFKSQKDPKLVYVPETKPAPVFENRAVTSPNSEETVEISQVDRRTKP